MHVGTIRMNFCPLRKKAHTFRESLRPKLPMRPRCTLRFTHMEMDGPTGKDHFQWVPSTSVVSPRCTHVSAKAPVPMTLCLSKRERDGAAPCRGTMAAPSRSSQVRAVSHDGGVLTRTMVPDVTLKPGENPSPRDPLPPSQVRDPPGHYPAGVYINSLRPHRA